MIRDILQDSKVVAIVGLSPNTTKDSHIVANYLKNNGYKIIPIYPSRDYILDSKVYRNIGDALRENDVDIVVVFRKSDEVMNVAKEIVENIKYAKNLKAKNLKALWLQLGIINNEARDLARRHNIYFIQDKCIKIEHKLLFDR